MSPISPRLTMARSAGQAPGTRRRFSALVLGTLLWAGASAFSIPAVAQHASPDPPWAGQEEAIEEVLLHGTIVASKEIGEGITKPLKVTLQYEGRQLDAVWKALDRHADPTGLERYEAEVAAYRLSRHLHLDMVPPTVPRRIGTRNGSVQMWVHGYRQAADLEAPPPREQVAEWSRDVARMKFFDELIDNPDRHAANYLVDGDWSVVLIDHSRALFFDHQGPLRQADPPKRFDRTLVERTRELDLAELDALLGDLFTKSDLKNVLHRRDVLVSHVDRLEEELGDLAYYVPER